jgi:hypothetical protein
MRANKTCFLRKPLRALPLRAFRFSSSEADEAGEQNMLPGSTFPGCGLGLGLALGFRHICAC